MTDGAALRELVLKERPHIIVPEIEALSTDTLAALESEGLAQVPPEGPPSVPQASRLCLARVPTACAREVSVC